MAILSNINGKFAVDSTGAIKFNNLTGTNNQVLIANTGASPTWVDVSTIIGGPYLPLTGGTLAGDGNLIVGGTLTVNGATTLNAALIGTTATFSGLVSGITPTAAANFATKAYVTFFSNALSEELHDTIITVTNLMPGATESEFGATSGMDKTKMFQKTATAYSVALDGYNGMLKGKLDVISGLNFGQKLMMASIPFMPKKMVLKQIRQMQEVKND